MSDNYDDIIHLPHHVSAKHPRMSTHDRAAQFSPFAALTGYGDAIREAERQTERRAELSEDMKDALDAKLYYLSEHTHERPVIEVIYFVPDPRKEGGSYDTVRGEVRSIDAFERHILLSDGRRIFMDDILDIRLEKQESI